MADKQESSTESSCDSVVSRTTLDPHGDVILVFNSKNRIVSSALDLNIQTAETSTEDQVQADGRKRKRSPDDDNDEEEDDDGGGGGIGDIEVRVSSKHLAFVSPVFKALFSDKFQEGSILQADGFVRVPLPDDPADGMIILLKVLHFQVTYVTPSLLMQIAQMVDKYDLRKIARLNEAGWYQDVENHVPTEWTLEVLDWMAIFNTLQWRDDVVEMMMIALLRIKETTTYNGTLPMQKVLSK